MISLTSLTRLWKIHTLLSYQNILNRWLLREELLNISFWLEEEIVWSWTIFFQNIHKSWRLLCVNLIEESQKMSCNGSINLSLGLLRKISRVEDSLWPIKMDLNSSSTNKIKSIMELLSIVLIPGARIPHPMFSLLLNSIKNLTESLLMMVFSVRWSLAQLLNQDSERTGMSLDSEKLTGNTAILHNMVDILHLDMSINKIDH